MQANEKQLEAIEKIEGPLLIIAGAGSGKTATLTKRVENMILNKNISPDSILMVTFTNKAANEMRERVAKTLGIEPPKSIYQYKNFPLIGTFHSIGIFILKEILGKNIDGITETIGLKKDFLIYDEQDKLSVIKNILKKLNIDEKLYPAKQIAFFISNAKNNLISPKVYKTQVDNDFKELVSRVYSLYEAELLENNSMDFDDILVKTYKLLQIEKILEYYQEKYRYLMVDEYQDTNLPQYHIVKLLASKYRNLAVVGDDAQSIYSWRGADMRNIINFKKDYPEALIVKLEQNYRSTKNIISGANCVIKNNNTGIKKELWTDNETGECINYIEALDDKMEAQIIANIIKEKGGNFADNLILYRTNAQSRQLEEALIAENIPYKVVGGLRFYERKEIKDLIAYLRVIFNKNDSVSMKRIINVPPRKIGNKTIETIENYKNNFSLNFIDIIENIDEVEELNSGAKNSIKGFLDIYKNLREKAKNISLVDLIKEILNSTKYMEYLTEGLTLEEKEAKEQNIIELENLASEYNGLQPLEGLAEFLENISLLTDLDKKEENDSVTLMTIHTSKGLEEKRVFLTGLEEGIFPGFRSISSPSELEEERRLMYVAMTRAKEELYLSRAKERFYFGEYKRNPESRFVGEIDDEFKNDFDISDFVKTKTNFFNNFYDFGNREESATSTIKLIKKMEKNDISDFEVGTKLSHPKFGNGIITELSGEIATIAFSGVGSKKMNIKIAPVRVIE